MILLLFIIGGCSSDASGAAAAKGAEAGSGTVTVHAPMEGTYPRLTRRSNFAQEPLQETWALRLFLDGGPEGRKQIIIDIDDIPADLGSGVFELGRGGPWGAVAIMSGDPMGSSPRFRIQEGSLELQISASGLSGAVTLTAEEQALGTPREDRQVISLEGEFEGVKVVKPEKN